MKIVAIGDTHGRDLWKEVYKKENDVDKFVFIGDYVDSFDVPPLVQLQNLSDIIELKKSQPEKIVLILGNHDYHYLDGIKERYSGYQDSVVGKKISKLLTQAATEGLINPLAIIDKHIFSHAGVTKTWFKRMKKIVRPSNNTGEEVIHLLGFNKEDRSGYGNHPSQSPIWVRPEAFIDDMLEGNTQVVGHTHHNNITYLEGKAIFIDCLDKTREYLVIEDGVYFTKKF